MKKFRLYCGEVIPDVGLYVKQYVKENSEVEVYIGTDSADRRETIYVTTIVFRHPGNGAHVIFRKEYEKKSPDLFTKLWREVEKTNEIAHHVRKYLPSEKILTVDLDLNSLSRHASNIAHDAARGYMIGQGFNVRTKPQAYSASRAADHLL